jgi:hypothetical protein
MENGILKLKIKGENIQIEHLRNNTYYATPYSKTIDEMLLMNSNELKEKLHTNKIIVQLSIDEKTQKYKGYYIKCI